MMNERQIEVLEKAHKALLFCTMTINTSSAHGLLYEMDLIIKEQKQELNESYKHRK